jgi:hypothetical protein
MLPVALLWMRGEVKGRDAVRRRREEARDERTSTRREEKKKRKPRERCYTFERDRFAGKERREGAAGARRRTR